MSNRQQRRQKDRQQQKQQQQRPPPMPTIDKVIHTNLSGVRCYWTSSELLRRRFRFEVDKAASTLILIEVLSSDPMPDGKPKGSTHGNLVSQFKGKEYACTWQAQELLRKISPRWENTGLDIQPTVENGRLTYRVPIPGLALKGPEPAGVAAPPRTSPGVSITDENQVNQLLVKIKELEAHGFWFFDRDDETGKMIATYTLR